VLPKRDKYYGSPIYKKFAQKIFTPIVES